MNQSSFCGDPVCIVVSLFVPPTLECIVCVSLASCFSHNTMRSVFGAKLWTNQDLVWFCSIFGDENSTFTLAFYELCKDNYKRKIRNVERYKLVNYWRIFSHCFHEIAGLWTPAVRKLVISDWGTRPNIFVGFRGFSNFPCRGVYFARAILYYQFSSSILLLSFKKITSLCTVR